jgi:hypothetical protein
MSAAAKENARLPAGAQHTHLTAQYTPGCSHRASVLLRRDCGAGGTQYRRYCMTCWRAGAAIPHALAMVEEARQGYPAPLADIDVLHDARDMYLRRGGA